MSARQHTYTCTKPSPLRSYTSFSQLPQTLTSQPQIRSNEGFSSLNSLSAPLLQLSKTIGYSNVTNSDPRTQKLVLADALTHIEILKFEQKVTRRPREMHADDVKKLLQDLIPIEKFLTVGNSKDAIEVHEWKASSAELMTAAAKYIHELEEIKKLDRKDKMTVSRRESLVKEAEKDIGIEQALVKIESWVDEWLKGEVTDWNSFENCLKK